MPIYEYQCEKCGETIEVLQRFSDAPLHQCPSCGGHVEKLMSMNSFQLKGSGWYVTDYKGQNSSTKAPAKEGASTETAAAPKATEKAADKA